MKVKIKRSAFPTQVRVPTLRASADPGLRSSGLDQPGSAEEVAAPEMKPRRVAPPAFVLCTSSVNGVVLEPQGGDREVSSLLANGRGHLHPPSCVPSARLQVQNQLTSAFLFWFACTGVDTPGHLTNSVSCKYQAWEERKEAEILPKGNGSELGEDWHRCQSYIIQSISPDLEIASRCSKKLARLKSLFR